MSAMKQQITDLKTQEKHPSRLSIYLDGRYYCGISEEVALKYKLKKGMEIDENNLKDMIHDDELQKAKKYVYNLLSRRMYSSKEVRNKLTEQGYTDDVIDQAISTIEGFGYIDDKTFAEEWVLSRKHNKPKGKIVLRRELAQKGINKEIIGEVLEEFIDDLDQLDTAVKLAQKKMLSYKNDDKISARRKLQSFLVRRGFDFDTIRKVVDKVLNEE
ncbi:TPA: regulatory protein RecX [bacterium]|nr:regulatory protein RecX [bacterium]